METGSRGLSEHNLGEELADRILISHGDAFPAEVRKRGFETAGEFVREHLPEFDETILRKLVGTAGYRILYKKEDKEATAALHGIDQPELEGEIARAFGDVPPSRRDRRRPGPHGQAA
jgi:hypothetical protein